MYSNQTFQLFHSFSLKPIKNMFTTYTLLQTSQKSHLHHCLNSQKMNFFSLMGFFGFSLSWSEISQSKQESQTLPSTSLCLSLSLSPFLFSCLSFSLSPSLHLLFFFPFLLFLVNISFLHRFCLFIFCIIPYFGLWGVLFLISSLGVLKNMKKMKGVAASLELSPFAIYEDQRARFKHQSLMQDFEDLHKETEAMRKKLQTLKEQKSTLLAEVRFLKRRLKFLMQNQSLNTPAGLNILQPQNMLIRSNSNMKEKKTTGKVHTLRRQGTGFDLNQKGKTYTEKDGTCAHPSPTFDLNQKQQKIFSVKEDAPLRSSLPVLDLNQKERLHSGKEAAAQSMAPVFDLNQISTDEEELQANDNSVRTEEFKKSSIRIGSNEQVQHNDIKISPCWNTGNGPNRVGKRKISWQDQVALRV